MRKFTKDNQGVALITVVIGVMFCLLLTSTMLRVSLLGLQSRSINNQVSDTFYDAENVVDTIRLNLQNTAAKAWATTSNDATSSYNFVAETYRLITGKAYVATGNLSLTSTTDKATAISNLTANAIQGGTVTDIGDIVRFNGETGKLEGITIKDVQIKYENPKTKMVSYVKTDITIRAPLYASKKKFPLASYSMFAGSGATIWNAQTFQRDENSGKLKRTTVFGEPSSEYPGVEVRGNHANPNQFGFWEQEGNVYIGYGPKASKGQMLFSTGTPTIYGNGHSADALVISDRETIIFTGENVVINGNILVSRDSNIQFEGDNVEVRGKIILGPNCHLIVSTSTILNCQDIWFFDNNNDVQGDKDNYHSVVKKSYTKTSNFSTYTKRPYDAWKASNNDVFQYTDAEQSIIYISGSTIKDATVSDGKVYAGSTPLSIYFGDKLNISDESVSHDPDLDPDPRRNTKDKNPQPTDARFSKYYDPFFIEMIDIEYFEKFCYGDKIKDVTQNAQANQRIKDFVAADKVIPTSTDLEGNSDGKKIKYTGVTLNGVNGPTFNVYFTACPTTGNGNIVNSKDCPFVLSNHSVYVNVDSEKDTYCGIVISSEFVQVKKDDGHCNGVSLLSLDADPNDANLKTFMNKVGAIVADKESAVGAGNLQYATFNNLFNGGIARFYTKPTGNNGSNYSIDVTHNQTMDLVDTNNFEKK